MWDRQTVASMKGMALRCCIRGCMALFTCITAVIMYNGWMRDSTYDGRYSGSLYLEAKCNKAIGFQGQLFYFRGYDPTSVTIGLHRDTILSHVC